MTKMSLRIFLEGVTLGPGKADLLGHIAATGSISAAGRAMGMSYKRAWSLVEEMNSGFAAPLVVGNRGGSGGGGASLTAQGQEVLALYRSCQQALLTATAPQLARLEALLVDGAQEAATDPQA